MRLLIVVLLLGLAGSVSAAESSAGGLSWNSINSSNSYRVEGQGDPMKGGARVLVNTVGDATGKMGGAITGLDAARFRGQRVTLSANLSATSGTNGVAIWIRADGVAGRLQFATSANSPVVGGVSPVRREVGFVVPSEAVQLVFGVVMNGNGGVEATDMRLQAASAVDVMESALGIVRNHALNADAIDWAVVPQKMREEARGARTPEDVYPAIRKLLAMLGDHHSFLIDARTAQQWERTATPKTAPVVKLLPDGIGYVSMPGLTGRGDGQAKQFTRLIDGEIRAIVASATAGWIVDLRDDTGGNMWPMLAALKSMLGDGSVGGFRGRDGQLQKWAIEPGDKSINLTGSKVAVLLGPKTSSSGEAVAVAFHGRPLTRSFGQPTDGRSTANGSFKLPDGSQILLTTAVDVDRNGVAFGGVMQPDEPTPPAADGRDPAIEAAAAWLHHEAGVARSR